MQYHSTRTEWRRKNVAGLSTLYWVVFTGYPLHGFSWLAEYHGGTLWPAWHGWHTGWHLRITWRETPLQPPAGPVERRPAIWDFLWKNSRRLHEPGERRVLSSAEDLCSSGTCGSPLRLWSLVETFSSWELEGAPLKLHVVLGAGVSNQRSLGPAAGSDVEGFCPFGDLQMNHDASPPTHSPGPQEKNTAAEVWQFKMSQCFIKYWQPNWLAGQSPSTITSNRNSNHRSPT